MQKMHKSHHPAALVPVELWIAIVRRVAVEKQRSYFLRFKAAHRFCYMFSSEFKEIRQLLTTDQFRGLERYCMVRQEWMRCPKDWMSMLRGPKKDETLNSIESECDAGAWGKAEAMLSSDALCFIHAQQYAGC